jgi:hypothetical protein
VLVAGRASAPPAASGAALSGVGAESAGLTGAAASGAAASTAVASGTFAFTEGPATNTAFGASVVTAGVLAPSTTCPGTVFATESASARAVAASGIVVAFTASDVLASTPLAHDKAGSAARANHHLLDPADFGRRLDAIDMLLLPAEIGREAARLWI